MGPDDGVQRILKAGSGCCTDTYGFANALWMRNGTFYAEARVFVRAPLSETRGVIHTVRVEASDAERAIDLLQKRIEARFGRIKWMHWRNPWGDLDA